MGDLRPGGLGPEGRGASRVSFGSQTHPADGTAGLIVTGEEKARELGGGEGVVKLLATGFARVAKARMPKAPVPAAEMALADAHIPISAWTS